MGRQTDAECELESLKKQLQRLLRADDNLQQTIADLQAQNASLQQVRELESAQAAVDEAQTSAESVTDESATPAQMVDEKTASEEQTRPNELVNDVSATPTEVVDERITADMEKDTTVKDLRLELDKLNERDKMREEYCAQLEAEKSILEKKLQKATKSNEKSAAEVFIQIAREADSLNYRRKEAEISKWKVKKLEKVIAAGREGQAGVAKHELKESNAAADKMRDESNKEGVERLSAWYAGNSNSRPAALPEPRKLIHTAAEALAFYEEGKLIGYYEHEISDDLKTAKVFEMHAKCPDLEKRIAYFHDESHKWNPTRLGRQVAGLLHSARTAAEQDRPELDQRLVKVQFKKPYLRLVPDTARRSLFWTGYEKELLRLIGEAKRKT